MRCRRNGGRAVEASYRDIYEKLWLAHALYKASWDGKKYRLFSESPIDYLLTDEDRETSAWRQYDHLMGRSDEFWDFVAAELGVTPDNEPNQTASLWAKWQTPRLYRWVETQISSHKLLDWPSWTQSA